MQNKDKPLDGILDPAIHGVFVGVMSCGCGNAKCDQQTIFLKIINVDHTKSAAIGKALMQMVINATNDEYIQSCMEDTKLRLDEHIKASIQKTH